MEEQNYKEKYIALLQEMKHRISEIADRKEKMNIVDTSTQIGNEHLEIAEAIINDLRRLESDLNSKIENENNLK